MDNREIAKEINAEFGHMINAAQVAKFMGTNRDNALALLKKNAVPGYKVEKRIKYMAADVAKMIGGMRV